MIHRRSAFGGPTMGNATSDWEDELERWLKPFLDRLGHKARRRMCPLYIAGLIGPGERKSVQPMAERFAAGDYDQLHHFIADGVWDATPLERAAQSGRPARRRRGCGAGYRGHRRAEEGRTLGRRRCSICIGSWQDGK